MGFLIRPISLLDEWQAFFAVIGNDGYVITSSENVKKISEAPLFGSPWNTRFIETLVADAINDSHFDYILIIVMEF